LALVLTVVAAMKKDLRWLLILAWPFATMAVWVLTGAFYQQKAFRILVTTLGTLVVIVGLYYLNVWLRPTPENTATSLSVSESQKIKQEPLSLKGLFLTDFGPNVNRARLDDRTLTIGSKTHRFPEVTMTFTAQLWIDLHEGTEFLGFYIPVQDRDPDQASKKTVRLCKYLPDQFPALLTMLRSLQITAPNLRGSTVKSTDLPLSRRAYIYHEDSISPQDLGNLVREYEARQLLIEFRGSEYLATQQLLQAARH
jgi:hypothetical protein